MTFEDLILNILRDNSGGIKMTGLVTEVVARACEMSKKGSPIKEFDGLLLVSDHTFPFLDALDCQLEEMQASGKLGLLKYACSIGDVREKQFIYLPLEQK